MEGSAIKSTNYAARLAMPLIHVGDRQESLEEWKRAPFSYTAQCIFPSIVRAFCCISDPNNVMFKKRLACPCLELAWDKAVRMRQRGEK